jgi:uncharacterized membrane protein
MMVVLTFVAVIGCGIVGGIFFAFSSFIMAALGRLPPEQGAAAMNSINVTVQNPTFFLTFFGTGLVCLALAVGSFATWDQLGGKLVLAAAVIYLVGCTGVTMVFNVPLNNALAATPDVPGLWSRYLSIWTTWNTVRTVACVASSGLFMAALVWRT